MLAALKFAGSSYRLPLYIIASTSAGGTSLEVLLHLALVGLHEVVDRPDQVPLLAERCMPSVETSVRSSC